MEEKKIELSHKTQMLLIILCWAVYTIAYLGRYSYTSNSLPIQKFYGVEKDEFSLATTFFFFAYGAGQIVNGLLCRRYNMRYMIFGALTISAIINFSVFLGLPFYLIKFVWLINGLCQSVLWSSLLRILSCYLDEKHMKTAIIFMSTTVSIGTFLTYGLSSLFALFNGFKLVFLVAFIAIIAIALIWFLFYGKLTFNAKLENTWGVSEKQDGAERIESKNKQSTYKGLLIILALFAVYAIVINFVKDGLTTWVPNILDELFSLPESLSIILTLVLPVFAVFGALAAVTLNRFIKDHSDMLMVFFTLTTGCVAIILLLLKTDYWYIILILFGIVNMLMHGSNNVVTSMLPLSVGRKYNAGLVGGLLNGACYIGSTASQYVIAYIATATDWNTVMTVLMYSCLAPVGISIIWRIIRLFNKGKSLY